jgi:hypothetical protein
MKSMENCMVIWWEIIGFSAWECGGFGYLMLQSFWGCNEFNEKPKRIWTLKLVFNNSLSCCFSSVNLNSVFPRRKFVVWGDEHCYLLVPLSLFIVSNRQNRFFFQEQLYTSFTLVFMFIIPLFILVSSYISTFRTISSKSFIFLLFLNSHQPRNNPDLSEKGSERVFKLEATIHSDHMRRSDSNRQKLIHKAKMKSLRISVVIVAAFIICWTPYYAMMLIFMFTNPDERLSEDLQSGIFFFGMSNSLINPLIYGAFQYQPIKKRRQYLQKR